MNRPVYGIANAALKISSLAPPDLPFSVKRSGKAVWCHKAETATKHVCFDQLRAMRDIDAQLMTGGLGEVSHKIICSDNPKYFSLGGDLNLFIRCVEEKDEQALSDYAVLAIRAIWANASGLGARQITTISLVAGEAQGGGFEAALSCDLLVAEAGSFFGFPESLFGLFPGMGGELLLRARVDDGLARKLVRSAHRYPAEMLFEMGIVDYLADKGEGSRLVHDLIARDDAGARFLKRQARLETIRYEELVSTVGLWVERALSLSPRQLRAMRYLSSAQGRIPQFR